MSDITGLPFSEEHKRAPYRNYDIHTQYVFNNNTTLLPVAKAGVGGDSLPAVITQLASPHGQKIVTWRCSRLGEMPILPDPEPNSDNMVIAAWALDVYNPIQEAGGTRIYEMGGCYVYHLRKPVTIKNGKFHLGGTPIDLMPASVNILTASNFTNSLTPSDGEAN